MPRCELLAGEARPLARGARVHVHHGTREAPGALAPLEPGRFDPGAEGLAQLRLERAAGRRPPATGFVLRQVAPPDTIGGGVVLDPRRASTAPARSTSTGCGLLRSGDPLERVAARARARAFGASARRATRSCSSGSCARARLPRRSPRVALVLPARLERARRNLLGALELGEPGRGLSRGALADAAGIDGPGAAALLDELVSGGEVQVRGGEFVSARAPSARDDPLARALVEALDHDALEPRATEALAAATDASRDAVTRALELLAAEGAVVRLRTGLYCDPAAEDRVRRIVEDLCRRDGHVTIATLRDELGTSRKYAQAFLEHLDASASLAGAATNTSSGLGARLQFPAVEPWRPSVRMRQSLAQLEREFEEEAARASPARTDAKRRDQAAPASAARPRSSRASRHASCCYSSIVLTVLVVTVAMFETLAWLMG